MAAPPTSSTITCGASSAMPGARWRAAWMRAIEPPSLWPTRSGPGASSCAKDRGQDLERLLVEERRGAGERRRLGASVTEARERDHTAAGRSVERPREAAPERDGPEPFVQQHERAPVRVAPQLGGFEPAPGDGEREGFEVRDGGMLPGAPDSRKARRRLRRSGVMRETCDMVAGPIRLSEVVRGLS